MKGSFKITDVMLGRVTQTADYRPSVLRQSAALDNNKHLVSEPASAHLETDRNALETGRPMITLDKPPHLSKQQASSLIDGTNKDGSLQKEIVVRKE